MKSMAQRKEIKTKYPLPKWFYGAIIFIAVLILGLLLYATGWPTYSRMFIGCGWKKPVYAYQTLGLFGERGELKYALPSDSRYRVAPEFDITLNRYYCSEDEARQDGFEHNES